MESFQSVCSVHQSCSPNSINLMTYLLKSTGPEITWYWKRPERFLLCAFLFPGLCKGGYYSQKGTTPLGRGVCHLQEFPYPTRARRITCIERALAARINTFSFTDLTCLCSSATQSVTKGNGVHDTLSFERFQNIWVLRSFIPHEKLKHIWNPRILFLHAAAIAKQPAIFTP